MKTKSISSNFYLRKCIWKPCLLNDNHFIQAWMIWWWATSHDWLNMVVVCDMVSVQQPGICNNHVDQRWSMSVWQCQYDFQYIWHDWYMITKNAYIVVSSGKCLLFIQTWYPSYSPIPHSIAIFSFKNFKVESMCCLYHAVIFVNVY